MNKQRTQIFPAYIVYISSASSALLLRTTLRSPLVPLLASLPSLRVSSAARSSILIMINARKYRDERRKQMKYDTKPNDSWTRKAVSSYCRCTISHTETSTFVKILTKPGRRPCARSSSPAACPARRHSAPPSWRDRHAPGPSPAGRPETRAVWKKSGSGNIRRRFYVHYSSYVR